MNWHFKSFNELHTEELYRLLQLRCKVFVVEQNCPYLDMDDKDQGSVQVWCSDASGRLLACCRLLPAGMSYGEPSIGRVATDPSVRGQKLGRELMKRAMAYIKKEWNNPDIRISAQEYLRRFYESLEFSCVSEVYDEDGIPHIEMLHRSS